MSKDSELQGLVDSQATLLEWMADASKGIDPGPFARSFPVVGRVWQLWLNSARQERV